MNDATTIFNRLRPRLQGIAYRMLGSSAEAEDVVQDAWLVSVTTRLAIGMQMPVVEKVMD